jgi:hypothetical protein
MGYARKTVDSAKPLKDAIAVERPLPPKRQSETPQMPIRRACRVSRSVCDSSRSNISSARLQRLNDCRHRVCVRAAAEPNCDVQAVRRAGLTDVTDQGQTRAMSREQAGPDTGELILEPDCPPSGAPFRGSPRPTPRPHLTSFFLFLAPRPEKPE